MNKNSSVFPSLDPLLDELFLVSECKVREHPNQDNIIMLMELLKSTLFPGLFGASDIHQQSLRYHLGTRIERAYSILYSEILKGLCFSCPSFQGDLESRRCQECYPGANQVTEELIFALPKIKRELLLDVEAAYKGDPAATSPDEVLASYPGILSLIHHRIAHQLFLAKVPIIPRMISERAHSLTGIDIHPGARIKDRFFIDHGTGVVIGETCEIGSNVKIYQGVTLGAKSFALDQNGQPIKGMARHPIVEDEVTIYAGATILGRITIGKGAVIGGNVWLTKSVLPNQIVVYQDSNSAK
ncbi:MAG: serine acetyltransferase [Oligoflexia bacterium]|nr:serine acetyltransferase [Oligoflexia bacterium]